MNLEHPTTQRKLRHAAFVTLVMGLWLAVCYLLPDALGYQLQREREQVAELTRNVSEPQELEKTQGGQETAPQGTTGASGSILATVTAYSELDTCPNRKCVMASGKTAYLGAAACPRSIPLGSSVQVAGTSYVCEDRTAERFDGRVDLFMGYGEQGHQDALAFGSQRLEVSYDLIP